MNALLEFIVRTALIAGATAIVLWALRIRTAAARHAAWSAVVIAMLLLPMWIAGGARFSVPVLEPADVASVSPRGLTEPAPMPAPAGAVKPDDDRSSSVVQPGASTPSNPWRPTIGQALIAIYLAGAGLLLVRLLLGTAQANRLRRSAVITNGQLTSDRCVTPITVGWFEPALILPAGMSP